jgi:hypothetical protein
MTRITDFALIIGAMKAGTTSLFDYLVAHPQIARCRPKEPNFFGSPKKWHKGREWYESLWPDYDPTRHAYALEASTHYAKHPMHEEAARRIAGFDARFKFLYIVRDPVARIESHIAHNIAEGRITLESYPKRVPHAVNISRYAFQLDRFRKAVGQEVLVLDFDELKDDPQRLLRRCTDFLGIDGFAFEARPPSNVRPARNGSETFRLSEAERRELRQELDPDMRRLGATWGIDVAKWGFDGGKPRQPVASRSTSPASARVVGAPPRDSYWESRQGLMYYEYIRVLGASLAEDAKSLIDVGSHSTSISEEFDWIPDRAALDRGTPYSSENVRGIKADFLEFEPDRRYDFALCLQVLEHVPQADIFAKKLLAVADRVLVSVPYRWPKGHCTHHCQDPVDEAKLAGWFGREPDYSLVVEEPFCDRQIGRRLISYFHTPEETFEPKRFRSKRSSTDQARSPVAADAG